MSEFKIELICRWSNGQFEQLVERSEEVKEDDDDEEEGDDDVEEE